MSAGRACDRPAGRDLPRARTGSPPRTTRAESSACPLVPWLLLSCDDLSLAIEELTHARVGAAVAQVGGPAVGDDAARNRVEHDGAIGDGEDALQLVRHHHEGEAEVLAQRQDGAVEPGGGD